MKTHTTASCFATYTLPHVLFVDNFEERRRIAMICCLAWNIGLFPDNRQREGHIEMVWNMGVNDNPKPPPDGMEHGWKSDMRMLVAQKHDLFPRLLRRILKAELVQQQPHDVLSVRTDDGGDEIPLVTHPRVEGLPHIIPALQRVREDTEKQVETLQRIAQIPGCLKTICGPAYSDGLLRATLRSYRLPPDAHGMVGGAARSARQERDRTVAGRAR
jgi:hypothetical protein